MQHTACCYVAKVYCTSRAPPAPPVALALNASTASCAVESSCARCCSSSSLPVYTTCNPSNCFCHTELCCCCCCCCCAAARDALAACCQPNCSSERKYQEPRTLCVQRGLSSLVLGDLHGHVLLAALAKGLLGLRHVHLQANHISTQPCCCRSAQARLLLFAERSWTVTFI
jgi:hypothetical protein